MSRRFALLRGINVGGRTVKSDELRSIFEELGFDDVDTFLASGNVVFEGGDEEAEALEAGIEAGLEDTLGFRPATFVRSCAELREAASPRRVAESWLTAQEGVKIHVVFLKEAVPPDLRSTVEMLRSDDDDFLAHGRELYWLRRGRMSDSEAWAPLEKALKDRGTTRTLNTVHRLLAKFCD